jgi:hypothetical protein
VIYSEEWGLVSGCEADRVPPPPQAGTAECPRNYFEHASGFQRCNHQSGPKYIQVLLRWNCLCFAPQLCSCINLFDPVGLRVVCCCRVA